MRDTFSDYHPILNMLYFLSVTGFAMFLRQPVCLAIAVVFAGIYSFWLHERKCRHFLFLLPMALLIIAINPLVNHQGMTVLGFFPNGNPFTLESIVYGLVAAGILLALILWFSCLNKVIDSEKWIYLLGRFVPALSLVLSMILRFVPMYARKFRTVAEAQKQLGKSMKKGSIVSGVRTGIRVLSIMLTWTMEHGIEVANSMRGRGYGLPGRTAYSLYRWCVRDTIVLLIILVLDGIVLSGVILGKLYWVCFPMIIQAKTDIWTIGIYLAYGVLMALPMILLGKEAITWK